MKKKITIALEESILLQIDKEVQEKKVKNRSVAIGNHLLKAYGNMQDVSVILFAHDNDWDDGRYFLKEQKGLLELNDSTVLGELTTLFYKHGISDFHLSIPTSTQAIFDKNLSASFPGCSFTFYEMNTRIKTGEALTKILTKGRLSENIFIGNGDVYFKELDVKKYFEFHQDRKADFSFCLKFIPNSKRLGNILIQGERVFGYIEKPKLGHTYLTNSGLYITTKSFLESQDFGEHLESDFFPDLVSSYHVTGYLYSGSWEHVQSNASLQRLGIKY